MGSSCSRSDISEIVELSLVSLRCPTKRQMTYLLVYNNLLTTWCQTSLLMRWLREVGSAYADMPRDPTSGSLKVHGLGLIH